MTPALEAYLDMTELLARVDGDRELLVELLGLFQEDFPRLQEALRLAVEAGNASQVEKAAHTLKGLFANLSIKLASQCAARVELAARAGEAQQILSAMAELDYAEAGLTEAVASFIVGTEP